MSTHARSPRAGLSLALLFSISITGCTPSSGPEHDRDDATVTADGGLIPPRTGDAGALPIACSTCAADEVCTDGRCVAIPDRCPCPVGSYCDLARDRCEAGCTSDDHCGAGTLCDVGARACIAGCRSDDECELGALCDGGECIAGCTEERGCPPGAFCSITEGEPGSGARGTCEPTCSGPADASCGGAAYCSERRCTRCYDEDTTSVDDARHVSYGDRGFGLICPIADRDFFATLLECSGTCGPDDRIGWSILVEPGQVPSCTYWILDGDSWETVASRLAGPIPVPDGGLDEFTCVSAVSGPMFDWDSHSQTFAIEVGIPAGSGIVGVAQRRPWELDGE